MRWSGGEGLQTILKVQEEEDRGGDQIESWAGCFNVTIKDLSSSVYSYFPLCHALSSHSVVGVGGKYNCTGYGKKSQQNCRNSFYLSCTCVHQLNCTTKNCCVLSSYSKLSYCFDSTWKAIQMLHNIWQWKWQMLWVWFQPYCYTLGGWKCSDSTGSWTEAWMSSLLKHADLYRHFVLDIFLILQKCLTHSENRTVFFCMGLKTFIVFFYIMQCIAMRILSKVRHTWMYVILQCEYISPIGKPEYPNMNSITLLWALISCFMSLLLENNHCLCMNFYFMYC